jgi:hypothetical protein
MLFLMRLTDVQGGCGAAFSLLERGGMVVVELEDNQQYPASLFQESSKAWDCRQDRVRSVLLSSAIGLHSPLRRATKFTS